MHQQLKTMQRELSSTECKVLALIRECRADKEIAAMLQISLSTAKFHVRNILQKKSVGSREKLIAEECPGGCPFQTANSR
jgi:DNA-binding NarL/FixJ family response regulator